MAFRSKPCSLCFQERSPSSSSSLFYCECALLVCNNCYFAWVAQTISSRLQSEQLQIKCPNSECRVTWSMREVRQQFLEFDEKWGSKETRQMLARFSEKAMEHYVTHTVDMRKCPKCSNQGFITLEPCNSEVQCDSCLHQWVESIHSQSPLVVRDSLTKLHHLLFEEPCPFCGVMVQKAGGCSYVQCGKCFDPFCWECLAYYPEKRHAENKLCPLRGLMLRVYLGLALLAMDVKVCLVSETLMVWEMFLAFNLGALAALGFYLLCIVGVFSIAMMWVRQSDLTLRDRMSLIGAEIGCLTYIGFNSLAMSKTRLGARELDILKVVGVFGVGYAILMFLVSLAIRLCGVDRGRQRFPIRYRLARREDQDREPAGEEMEPEEEEGLLTEDLEVREEETNQL